MSIQFHIKINGHFVDDELLKDRNSTHDVITNIQLVNVFTKALGKQQFEFNSSCVQ